MAKKITPRCCKVMRCPFNRIIPYENSKECLGCTRLKNKKGGDKDEYFLGKYF